VSWDPRRGVTMSAKRSQTSSVVSVREQLADGVGYVPVRDEQSLGHLGLRCLSGPVLQPARHSCRLTQGGLCPGQLGCCPGNLQMVADLTRLRPSCNLFFVLSPSSRRPNGQSFYRSGRFVCGDSCVLSLFPYAVVDSSIGHVGPDVNRSNVVFCSSRRPSLEPVLLRLPLPSN